jgi:WD40 repeat protein
MTRTKLFFAFALVFAPLAVLTSAPAPTDKLHLAPAGTVKAVNLAVNDAALIDENRIVLVGWQGDANDGNVPDPDGGVPNGAIIDLTKKSVQPFADRHTSQIWSVSSYGGRVVSGSISRFEKALLCSWDLKAQKNTAAVKLAHAPMSYRFRCFHRSSRIVLDETERLLVLDPARPQERMELPCPPDVKWLSYPLAVSPDDAWIACIDDRGQVVCFELATKKATVTSIAPQDARGKWRVSAFAFAPSGKLFVCRYSGKSDEVPKGKDEKDVPAERRGIVRVDLPEGKAVPLKMGHTSGPSACAVDGTETWLATVGLSRADKNPDQDVGELRVYNISSGKLAYREQLKDGVPGWVWFTPSGKRLVCATNDGIVRWWDVPVR